MYDHEVKSVPFHVDIQAELKCLIYLHQAGPLQKLPLQELSIYDHWHVFLRVVSLPLSRQRRVTSDTPNISAALNIDLIFLFLYAEIAICMRSSWAKGILKDTVEKDDEYRRVVGGRGENSSLGHVHHMAVDYINDCLNDYKSTLLRRNNKLRPRKKSLCSCIIR